MVACGATAETPEPDEPAERALVVHNGHVLFEGGHRPRPPSRRCSGAARAKSPPSDLHIESAGVFDKSRGFQGKSIQFPTSSGKPWPNETIYYRFDSSVSTAKQSAFQDAVIHYRNRTSLRWIQVDSTFGGNYVLVKGNDTSSLGCWSSIGDMEASGQELQVGRSDCDTGSMIHEMGHAAGLIHEHQRPDRDTYVTVVEHDANWGQGEGFVGSDVR